METIEKYLRDSYKYKIDYEYQRPAGAWSREDKQCLIDTILKEEPMPLFFINVKNDGYNYVVDGQQRLEAISEFYNGKFGLNKKFSGSNLDGIRFEQLDESLKNKFFSYKLNMYLLDNYDDEKVRILFSKLQRGKPLSIGEKMNAMPGNIVRVMRELAKHPFITDTIAINQDRYGAFPDVMRILYYETNGATDSSSDKIYSFMSDNKDIDFSNKYVKQVESNLNYLKSCFPEKHYHHLEKHTWVLTVYTLISELKNNYVLVDKNEEIGEFVKKFHSRVYTESWRHSKPSLYQKFYDNVRGGWSKNFISIRLQLIKQALLDEIKLTPKDTKRQISNEEKIALFNQHPTCQKCGYKFKDYKEPEYHHVEQHANGGNSTPENIMVLCKNCHHKTYKHNYSIPSEDEFLEADV